MTMMKLISLAALCLALLVPISLRADTLGLGTINGYLYGHNGAPVPEAAALVFQAQPDGHWTDTPYAKRTTNQKGFFSFIGLPQGKYFVLATKNGYQPDCTPRLVVVSNALQRVTLHLRPKGTAKTACPENAGEGNEIYF